MASTLKQLLNIVPELKTKGSCITATSDNKPIELALVGQLISISDFNGKTCNFSLDEKSCDLLEDLRLLVLQWLQLKVNDTSAVAKLWNRLRLLPDTLSHQMPSIIKENDVFKCKIREKKKESDPSIDIRRLELNKGKTLKIKAKMMYIWYIPENGFGISFDMAGFDSDNDTGTGTEVDTEGLNNQVRRMMISLSDDEQ